MSEMGHTRDFGRVSVTSGLSRSTDIARPALACLEGAKTGSDKPYSITSSARARRDAGISIPSDFAVLRLMSKQEFGGLLNRKLGRFGAFQNSIDIVGPTSSQGGKVRAVRN